MRILIVNDHKEKADQLRVFIENCYADIDIKYSDNARDGFLTLESNGANLVLLDVVLPMEPGGDPSEEGSIWFVREVKRKLGGIGLPFIVGTTQYAESLAKVQEIFRNDLWNVIQIGAPNDRWPAQIEQAIRFTRSNAERLMLSKRMGGEQVDVALITALRTPEFSELVLALGGGEQLQINETNEMWVRCLVRRNDGREIKVVAACADEMGMATMASLVTKLSICCGPKHLVLAGIMAGNPQRVDISDMVIIESTWNSQSGKLTDAGFSPDVKSLSGDYKLGNAIAGLLPEEFVLEFWKNWRGEKPRQIAKVHRGEVACSPFVVADAKTFPKLEQEQKRKILGLEMEAYGCYDAARRLGDLAPRAICLKSVCDFGDGTKNDQYQGYCAALSAAAVVHAIKDARFFGEV